MVYTVSAIKRTYRARGARSRPDRKDSILFMKEKIPLKELLALLGLTVSAFIFNTSEFIPIGLLSDIAASFGLTEAAAGLMITVYSWAVMLLSLPLMLLVCRMDFRRLLLGTCGLFFIFQLLSAMAPSFFLLLLARLGVACAHAVFWSIASPAAVRIVPEKHQPLALSMIVTGTSIAMILGMPLGRMIGLSLGWRMTFLTIGGVALAVTIYLGFLFPKIPGSQSFTLGQLPALFKRPALTAIYILTFLIAGAYYTGYSYIEPFLKQVGGLGDGTITLALTVFGAAGLLGSFLFSRFYSRARSLFLILATAGVAGALLLLLPASASAVLVVVLCAFWGMSATAFNVTCQSEVIRCAPGEGSAVAMSIFSGIFNLGIGCGTWLGGAICTGASIQWIGFAGGAVAALASLYCGMRVTGLLKAG